MYGFDKCLGPLEYQTTEVVNDQQPIGWQDSVGFMGFGSCWESLDVWQSLTTAFLSDVSYRTNVLPLCMSLSLN